MVGMHAVLDVEIEDIVGDQGNSTHDRCLHAESRRYNLNILGNLLQRSGMDGFSHPVEKDISGLGDPSAHHHRLRIKDIDQIGDSDPQIFRRTAEHVSGHLIALLGGPDDHLG